jgi:hypothetical protein
MIVGLDPPQSVTPGTFAGQRGDRLLETVTSHKKRTLPKWTSWTGPFREISHTEIRPSSSTRHLATSRAPATERPGRGAWLV